MSKKSFSGSWRGVVGIIKPTYRPGSLEEFIRLLPEGIGVIPKFVGVNEGLEKEFVDGFAVAEKIIAELAEMNVDLIHPEGAPLFVQKGFSRSEEIVKELERKYSIPVVTTGMVLVEAAKALGIKKLLVISSFDDGNSSSRLAKYSSYFSDAGFQVQDVAGFPVAFADIGSVSPYEAYAFARKLYSKISRERRDLFDWFGLACPRCGSALGTGSADSGRLRRRGQGLGDRKKIARKAAGQRSRDLA